MSRLTDVSILQKEVVWVLLRYDDSSEFCFQTTLCPSILRTQGIILEEGKLPRIDKKYYYDGSYVFKHFSTEGAVISLWTEMTYTHAESKFLHIFL